ncbi:glycoside hydrolase family 88 protein [Pedobacter gandavensis]|uniref:glycoside hydrolase family 88/105 protein n=1 Tax=Pedobacter gandavensis TaxID=2679963 RepID=UPI00292E66FF|nr:glycoside hydrolase family 88 protein [Pedobacter gandavensis]
MRKSVFLIPLTLFLFGKSNAQQKQQRSASSIISQMKNVADWQWTSLETEGWKNPKKDWTSGAMYTGMMAWSQLADTNLYYQKLIQVAEDNKWKTGGYRFFADDYCVGQTYAQLYNIYKTPVFIEDLKNLGDSLVKLPHTESLEWKNGIYTREWAWCDALFMGPPALAYLSEATGDPKYINKASELWWKSTAYLFDKEEHLFYRDSRYFNKKEKNGAKVFWSRGNGWVIAGLARVLSVMPENHPDRKRAVDLFIKMSEKLAKLQQADGTWHASLLDPESYPSKETSGTGFICYAMTWGVNNGLISYKKYEPVISKAWEALSTSVHPNGKLGFVQPQGAAPDKVGYEDTDVFGVGAFLLAGTEMFRLELKHNKNILVAEAHNRSSSNNTQTILIPWNRIVKTIKIKDPKQLLAKNAATAEIVPLNVNYKGKKITEVSITTNLSGGASKFFEISTK